MRIYGDIQSGNCLKVKYTADVLGLPYEWVHIDIMRGESRTPEFLARNITGQVPVIELDDGRYLSQSNAIIRFLAKGSALFLNDPFLQAKVDEWLFWEQNSHEFFVAGARFQVVYMGRPIDQVDRLRIDRGNEALDLMEKVLGSADYLAWKVLTIADIALLPYTRMAGDGGFDLSARPHLSAWIKRCEGDLGLGTYEGN
jgi:glutathione S-transferase